MRSIPLTHLLAGIVTLGVARACYYYYYIEDPNNFAYRYCSVGCGKSVKPGDPDYAQCCIPLSSGAPTPSTCTALASSASAAGTMCSWSAVPTTDMQPPPTPKPTTNKINAIPTASCETTWVTETVLPTACAPTYTAISSSSLSSSSSSSQSSWYSPPSTSKIEALPTSELPPRSSSMTISAPTSDLTISDEPSPSLEVPEPPSYKAGNTPLPLPPTTEPSLPPVLSATPTPTTSSTYSSSFYSSSTYNSSSSYTPSTSEIKAEPTCSCGPLPVGAGALPPDGFSKRNLPHDDCTCDEEPLPVPEPESSTLPSTSEIKALPTSMSEPKPSSTCSCPKAPVGAGSLPKEPMAKRDSDDDCDCGLMPSSTEMEASAMPSTSEIKALPTSASEPEPTSTCSCPKAPVGAGSLPQEPMAKRDFGNDCDCGVEASSTSTESSSIPSTSEIKALPTASRTGSAPDTSCSCGPLPAGSGSLPKEPIARRSEDGACDCGTPPPVPEPEEECDCDAGPLPVGAGSTPPDNLNWKRTKTGCNCPQRPCDGPAPVGAGAARPEGFDAMRKRDGSCAAGSGDASNGESGLLEAKPISEDQKFDGLRRRRLPPASLQPEQEPVPEPPSPDEIMPSLSSSTSKVKALPTSADAAPTPPPVEEKPEPSKCVTTMTTTITPSCTPIAEGSAGIGGVESADAGEDDYDGIEDCDEDEETFDLEDQGTAGISANGSADALSPPSKAASSTNKVTPTASAGAAGKDDTNIPFPARPGDAGAAPSEGSDLEELGFGKGGSEPLDFESLE